MPTPKVADRGPLPAPPATVVVLLFAFVFVCSLGGAWHRRGYSQRTQLVAIVSRARLHKPSGSFRARPASVSHPPLHPSRSSGPHISKGVSVSSSFAEEDKSVDLVAGAWSVEDCLSALRENWPGWRRVQTVWKQAPTAERRALSRELSHAIQPKQNVDQNYNSGSLQVYSPIQYLTRPTRERAALQTRSFIRYLIRLSLLTVLPCLVPWFGTRADNVCPFLICRRV